MLRCAVLFLLIAISSCIIQSFIARKPDLVARQHRAAAAQLQTAGAAARLEEDVGVPATNVTVAGAVAEAPLNVTAAPVRAAQPGERDLGPRPRRLALPRPRLAERTPHVLLPRAQLPLILLPRLTDSAAALCEVGHAGNLAVWARRWGSSAGEVVLRIESAKPVGACFS